MIRVCVGAHCPVSDRPIKHIRTRRARRYLVSALTANSTNRRPSVNNDALDHLLLVSSPQFQKPPSGDLCSRRRNYRCRTSHQGSRTRPPRCVVFAPSSNDESGTVCLDHLLLGPSPMGQITGKSDRAENSKEVLDIEWRSCSMQVLNLTNLKKGEHKSQELQVNDVSLRHITEACPDRSI